MADKKKILVIDDESDLCVLVKDNLERRANFEVVIVTNELQSEEVCCREKPDLVLLDVVMPERKGSEVAKSLKSNVLTKDIPIIIMSGLGEMVYFKEKDQWKWLPDSDVVRERGDVVDEISPRRAADVYGVDDYISKPFSSEVLIELINDVLSRKKR